MYLLNWLFSSKDKKSRVHPTESPKSGNQVRSAPKKNSFGQQDFPDDFAPLDKIQASQNPEEDVVRQFSADEVSQVSEKGPHAPYQRHTDTLPSLKEVHPSSTVPVLSVVPPRPPESAAPAEPGAAEALKQDLEAPRPPKAAAAAAASGAAEAPVLDLEAPAQASSVQATGQEPRERLNHTSTVATVD
mmetsp:Transcript_94751/g.163898  ORF Transcript_94751/g.163898 Transcript_94751/m.163898 type:complete len:188 (+) Transcript_94751:3-566(+)